ncbi:MAG: acyl-CoA thioesterase II [Bacteroidota bacterium]|jgi:acyl-CoA thioesterase-2
MKEVSELLDLLKLEQIEENLFRGHSKTVGSTNVFGGQVLAQSLSAAINTVPSNRQVHSLHSYFILPGNLDIPIIFQVDRIRDGGSFTTRRVKAIQQGREIFLMSASFQSDENGFDHQITMPEVQSPEQLVSWKDLAKHFGEFLPQNMYDFLNLDRPIEFRPVELYNPAVPEKREPFRHIWMKSIGEMPENANLHQLVLAYASDYNLLTSALLPHGKEGSIPKLQLASLDHAMWFHRPFRMDDWLLYAIDSPSASNSRGFTRGNIFTRDGKLVASVAQEGLMRPRKQAP